MLYLCVTNNDKNMMNYQVTEVNAKSFGKRKVYSNVDPSLLNFTSGIRVLPASLNDTNSLVINFVSKHEPGEKFFPEGGYSCVDSSGAKRSFYLDELIIHPNASIGKNLNTKPKSTRGRKKSKV